ncbi:MAG: putative toxin-antitoxin system toxin component, PIN family [Defluviitaleaceae bacterium]|nr:putative toxin-antitoxin system toxin component, PIN family [Defluviitaleaceae bacterium]
MRVVLDTNVIVSALWSANNRLAQILALVIDGSLIPCYDSEIMQEYVEVLNRPHLAFRFAESRVDRIIEKIKSDGICVVVNPSTIPLIDENDRCFYDVAKACNAILITGNTKHYPTEPFIMNPAQFLDL